MNSQVIKNRIRKVLAYSITGIIFLFIASFLILQIPPVQNAIVGKVLKSFSGLIGFKTNIKNFQLLWFDRLELEGVSVLDPENNKMISAERILVNFKLLQLFNQSDVDIDGVVIDSAHVFLTKIAESDTSSNLNINVFINQINEQFSSGSGGGKSPQINIGEAILNQCQFTYINQYKDSLAGFDYNHFRLAIDEGHIQNFLILGDTTQFDITTLIAEDQKTKFKVNHLSTFFRSSQASMEFSGLNLQAGKSTITDTVLFTFNGQRNLINYFIDSVNIHAHLNKTILYPEDLALFAPETKQLGKPVTLKGIMDGQIRKFAVTGMEAGFGDTHLQGSLEMDGLPDINETFIVLNLKKSKFNFTDFNFLLNETLLSRLKPFGEISLNGQFLGYPNDFVANGDFNGKLGRIHSDINFKVNEKNGDKSSYNGKLSMLNFDLGTYLRDTVLFQRVTLDGRIRGSGLTLGTANFSLDGKVNSVGIKGYNYSNITTNARFASEFFNGILRINDPNLEFTARGSVDLRKDRNIIKIQASVDKAELHKLQLSPKALSFQTKLDVNFTGLHLDSLVGRADFKDFILAYEHDSIKLKSIQLNSERQANNRSINLETSLVDAEVKGNFQVTEMTKDIQNLFYEMSLNIRNNKEEIEQYYQAKKGKPASYQATFAARLKEINPISKLLKLDLKIAPNTSIEGNFSSGYTTILRAFTLIDSLEYQHNLMLKTEIEITASKIADSTSVLAMAFLNSARQVLKSGVKTRDLLVEGIWNRNHIGFDVDCQEQDKNNYVKLKGTANFLNDSTVIKLLPSAIHLLERDWLMEPTNEIVVNGTEWHFHNMDLINNEQSVKINGFISEDSIKTLRIKVDQLDLTILNVLSKNKFAGILNGDIFLNNYYRNSIIENDIAITDFTVEDFVVGNIIGKNHWNRQKRKFDINFFIDKNNERIINLSGSYMPADKESPLNITATLDKANLKIAEPFLRDLFSNLGGNISGTYKITGTYNHPILKGEATIPNGYLTVNYLKTPYRFNGDIELTPNSINFNNIELTDNYKNTAHLTGHIYHKNFADMRVDIGANFRNFQVLNTTLKDNDLFHGQAFASGELNLLGPLENIKISSTAKTEKNTRLYIPIGGASSVEKKDFINFISLNDSTYTKQEKNQKQNNKINLTGLIFDLNIDITPDAYCEIIMDIKTGDIIRGRGQGDLKLQLDTKGEFNMFGNIEFTEGWYNFTLYDILNKDFEIKRGSRITWYGDPYTANVDITGFYNQLASFAPVVDAALGRTPDAGNTPPELRRKYMAQVILKLDGPLLSPQISFDIAAKDLPQTSITIDGTIAVQLSFMFQAFKNKLDEQGLNKQVFSLIMLRKFSPPDSFDTGGSLYNSVSELFSNQLSYWMSQVDENLEISLDLGTMDDNKFNNFQLRLSYTFLNGRLRITRDGTFGNSYANAGTLDPSTGTTGPNTIDNRGSISSIAGDWTVDYYLTADGKFKIKMYNRTNYNQFTTSLNNQSYFTTGVSLQHIQSFNELKDLLKFSRNKRKNESNAIDPEINDEAIKDEDESGQ